MVTCQIVYLALADLRLSYSEFLVGYLAIALHSLLSINRCNILSTFGAYCIPKK